MNTRAVAPAIGVVLLVLLVVGLGATVGVTVLGTAPADPPPRASVALAVDADADRITVTHRRGDPIDPERASVRIEIDGTELARQPPVPFFSVRGFEPGPTGPFNSRWTDEWTVGDAASLRIASTNSPGGIASGETVRVVLRVDDRLVADEEATA